MKFRDLHSTVFEKLAEFDDTESPDPDSSIVDSDIDGNVDPTLSHLSSGSNGASDGLTWLDAPQQVPEDAVRDRLDVGAGINLGAPLLLDILSETPIITAPSKGKEKAVETDNSDGKGKGKQKELSVDELDWSLDFVDEY